MAKNSLFGNLDDIFESTDQNKEVDSLFKIDEQKPVKLSSAAESSLRAAQSQMADAQRQASQAAQAQQRQAQQGAQAAQRQLEIESKQTAQYVEQQQKLLAEQEEARQKALEQQQQVQQRAMQQQAAYEEAVRKAEEKRKKELAEKVGQDATPYFGSSLESILSGKNEEFNKMGTLQQQDVLESELDKLEEILPESLGDEELAKSVLQKAESQANVFMRKRKKEADNLDFSDIWVAGKKLINNFSVANRAEDVAAYSTVKQGILDPSLYSTPEEAERFKEAEKTVLKDMKNKYGYAAPTAYEIANNDPKAIAMVNGFINERLPKAEKELIDATAKAESVNAEYSEQVLDEQKNVAYARAKFLEENPDATNWQNIKNGLSVAKDNWASFAIESAPSTVIMGVASAAAGIASTASGGFLSPAAGALVGAVGSKVALGGMGGTLFTNEVSSAARETIQSTPVEELRKVKGWDSYVKAAGGNEELAKLRLGAAASATPDEKTFAIGAALSLFGVESLVAKTATRIASSSARSTASTLLGRAGSVVVSGASEFVEEGATTLAGNMILQEDAFRSGQELQGQAYYAKIMEDVFFSGAIGGALGLGMGGVTTTIGGTVEAFQGRGSGQGNGIPPAVQQQLSNGTFNATLLETIPPAQRAKALATMQANAGYIDTQELKKAWFFAIQDMDDIQAQAYVDAMSTDTTIVGLTQEQSDELNTFLGQIGGKNINTNPFLIAGKTAAQAAFEGDKTVQIDPLTRDALAVGNGNTAGVADVAVATAVHDLLTMTSNNASDTTGTRTASFIAALEQVVANNNLTEDQVAIVSEYGRINLNASRARMTAQQQAQYQAAMQGVPNAPTAMITPTPTATARVTPALYANGSYTTTTNVVGANTAPTATTTQQPTVVNNATTQTNQTGQTATTNAPGTSTATGNESTGTDPTSQAIADTAAAVIATQNGTGIEQDATAPTGQQRIGQTTGDAGAAQRPDRTTAQSGTIGTANQGNQSIGLADTRTEETPVGSGSVGTQTTERSQDGQRPATAQGQVDDVIIPPYVATPIDSLVGRPVRYKRQSGTIITKPGRLGYFFLPYDANSPEVTLYGSASNKTTAELLGVEPLPYRQINSTRNALSNIASKDTPVDEVRKLLNSTPSISEPVNPDALTVEEQRIKAEELMSTAAMFLGDADARELMYDIIDIMGTDATNDEIILYYENTLEQIKERKRNEDGTVPVIERGRQGAGYFGTQEAGRQTQEANQKAILNVSAVEMDDVLSLLSFEEYSSLTDAYEAVGYPSGSFEQWLREEMGKVGTDGLIGDMKEYLLAERGDLGVEVELYNENTAQPPRRRRRLTARNNDNVEPDAVTEQETAEPPVRRNRLTARNRDGSVVRQEPQVEPEPVYGDGRVVVEEVIAPNIDALTEPDTQTGTDLVPVRGTTLPATTDGLQVYTVEEYTEMLNNQGVAETALSAVEELPTDDQATINNAIEDAEIVVDGEPVSRAQRLAHIISESIFGRVTNAIRSAVRKLLNVLAKLPRAIAIVSVAVATATASPNAQGVVDVDMANATIDSTITTPTNVVNQYVQSTNDAQGKNYMVADKVGATVTIFSPTGEVIATTPALFGAEVGDTKSNKATPAGKFELQFENTDAIGYGGNVQSFSSEVVERADGTVAKESFALHRLYTQNASENRRARLTSQTPADNRISNGCINLPTDFYNTYLNGDFDGYIYVIPETDNYTGNRFGTGTTGQGERTTTTVEQQPATRGTPTEQVATEETTPNQADAQETATATETPSAEAVNSEKRRAYRASGQSSTTLSVDEIVNQPAEVTGPRTASASPVVVQGSENGTQTASIEPIVDASGSVVHDKLIVPDDVVLPADQSIEPEFNSFPVLETVNGLGIAGVALGMLAELGLSRNRGRGNTNTTSTATPRRRKRKLRKKSNNTGGLTAYTRNPNAQPPGALPAPVQTVPAPTPLAQAQAQVTAAQQTYQAAWFKYMVNSGQVAEDILTNDVLNMANTFIGDVFLDTSKRFSETNPGEAKRWRGIFGPLTEGVTFWYMRLAGGATPRTDNYLIRHGAARYGNEADSTVFGTALAGIRAKSSQAFEYMQAKYIQPIDDFLLSMNLKVDYDPDVVRDDMGNYATLYHLNDNAIDAHIDSLRADAAEAQVVVDSIEQNLAQLTVGTVEYGRNQAALATARAEQTRLENKAQEYADVVNGVVARPDGFKLVGGRTRAEVKAEMKALEAKYDQADLDTGRRLIMEGIEGVRNYSMAAGGIDAQTAEQYANSGLNNYVPLYAKPEDISADEEVTDAEQGWLEQVQNQLTENEVRSIGLGRDPSRLRRKGATNPSDHAINNLARMAYIQSDMIAQAPVRNAMTQLFEQDYMNLPDNATQQEIEDALVAMNTGDGGTSSIPGIVRFKKGDPRAKRFAKKDLRPLIAKGHDRSGMEHDYEYYFTNPDMQNELYNNLPVKQKDEMAAVAQLRSATRGVSRLMTQFRPVWNLYAYPKEAIERGANLFFRNLVDIDGNVIPKRKIVSTYMRLNKEIVTQNKMEIYRYLTMRETKTRVQQELAAAQASGAIQLYTDVLDKTQAKEQRRESLSTQAIKATTKSVRKKLNSSKGGQLVDSKAQDIGDLYMKGLVELPQVISALSMYKALKEEGVTTKEAANRTRDMFDPSRAGQWQSEASAFFPFIRSAMAGNYTTWRSISQNGVGGLARLAIGFATMLGLISLAGALVGDDEDDNPKIASLSTLRGIPIPMGDEGIFYVPVGFGLPGMMLQMAHSGYKSFHGKAGPGDVFADTMSAITTNTSPIQAADASILKDNAAGWAFVTITPEIAQPLAEVAINRRAFGGGQIYYGQTPQDERDADQGSFRTPEVYKGLASSLADAGIDARPESVQYVVENLLGYGPLRAIPNAMRDADERTAGLDVSNAEQSGMLGALTGYDINLDRKALDLDRQAYPLADKAKELGKKYQVYYVDSERDPSSKESSLESFKRRVAEAGISVEEQEYMVNTKIYSDDMKGLRKEFKAAAEAFNEARENGDDALAEEAEMALAYEAIQNRMREYVEQNNEY